MTTPAVEEKTPPSDTNRPVGEDRRATDKEEETSAVQRRTTDTPFERSAALIGTSVSSGDLESPKLGVVVPTEKELAQQQESLQLQTLARQLEYYFSKQNLATDTYLQTLRDLNDGCVPVTILANFCKVKAILKTTTTPEQQHQKKTSAQHKSSLLLQEEELRMHAILQAVNEYYTDLLQVHSIDTATGKIATDDTPSSAITILAVGPVVRSSNTANATATTAVSKELQSPGSITALVAASSPSSSSLEQQPPPAVVADYSNMIILRDVDAVVTDAEVRGLFDDIEECPPVVSVVSDVANSWYVVQSLLLLFSDCSLSSKASCAASLGVVRGHTHCRCLIDPC